MSPRRWITCLTASAAAGVLLHATRPVAPDFAVVRDAQRPSDVRLLDRHGAVLHEQRADTTRRRLAWAPLAAVSPALRAAVVASEDRRFASHDGVDLRALAAALLARVTGGQARGASTITMQVAALTDPDLRRRAGTRTWWQKWRQMRLAYALERRWTKPELLEAYLNLVTFRGELVGIGAATHVLLGKAPHGVTPAEAAVLAALLPDPNAEVPALLGRARRVRTRAALDADDAALAEVTAEIVHGTTAAGTRPAWAPHAARRLLAGAEAAPAAPPRTDDRTDVRSTLDAATQQTAIAALSRNLLAARDRNVRDGAVLVLDNASGDVLAYVGSSGRLSAAPQVDGVRARRQPGSALKPFLYGLALEQRLVTPVTLLDDAPLEVSLQAGLYRPANYDHLFRGPVSVRTALAASLNVPAVRMLLLVGGEALLATLRAAGFDGLRRDAAYYGPSLALGSSEVSLWEITNAYRALAEGGTWTPARLAPLGPLHDASGGIDGAAAARMVFSPATAFLLGQILADRDSRSLTFGLENVLATRGWSAVKTGTSKDMRDNWCVGWSPRFTVGVWVGNFSGAPMHDVSGVTGAAPVWRELMDWLHREQPARPPAPPAGVVARDVAPANEVEPARREWFLAGTEPATAAAGTLVHRTPRIRAPAAGTRLALDPDIPPDRQRLLLAADGEADGLRWALDGADLGTAETPRLWRPRPGRHTLALRDRAGHDLDRVDLDVRGGTR